jgi:hypothetical protein
MLSVACASATIASQFGCALRRSASLASSASHQRRPPSISTGGSPPSGNPASASRRRGSSGVAISCTRARGVRTAIVRSRPAPVTISGSLPAIPSCTSSPSRGAARPASSKACAVPTLGWPANGTSRRGLKMRMRWVASVATGGSTKVVSGSRVQRAIACMRASSRPSASSTTASGLPSPAREANTSSCT